MSDKNLDRGTKRSFSDASKQAFSKAKGVLDVVTSTTITGQPGALVWKYPHNVITAGSIVQVSPIQDAVFLKGGGDFEIFEGPQELTVDSKALPFLQRIMNAPFGGKTPYTANIWFLNKTVFFPLKWGTPSSILLKSPHDGGMVLPIRSRGAFRLLVKDTRSFFVHIVGTAVEYNENNLRDKLKEIVKAKIDGIMRRYAQDCDKSFLELGGDNEIIAQMMHDACKTEFERFGLHIDGSDAYVDIDRDHKNFKRLEERDASLYEADGDIEKVRRRQETLGYSYMQDRQMDVMQTLAGNESSAGASMAGLGAGLGMMGAVAGQVQGMMNQPQYPQQGFYPQQGYPPQQGGFPPQQGYPPRQGGFPPQQGFPSSDLPGTPQAMGMPCPSCGTMQNPAKFCNECGSPMKQTCPGCSVNVEAGQKFCNECGTKLL